ncbi:MAG: hypothetical protein OEL76_12165 [Siculibacillus sp.]|nr:hypothetical protein [Siculibacillus sp.]
MPSRRLFLALLATTLATPSAVAAAPAGSPEAFVAAIYARITAGDGTAGGSEFTDPTARDRWFTAPVVEMWREGDERAEKDGDIGPVDFDLLTASQDPMVRRVAVEPRGAGADVATVRVGLFSSKKAKPGEKPYATLDFVLKRAAGGWRIDDVLSRAKETWTLRELLAAP